MIVSDVESQPGTVLRVEFAQHSWHPWEEVARLAMTAGAAHGSIGPWVPLARGPHWVGPLGSQTDVPIGKHCDTAFSRGPPQIKRNEWKARGLLHLL